MAAKKTTKKAEVKIPSGKPKTRAWVQRYPDYPDLLDGCIGDIQARLDREAIGFRDIEGFPSEDVLSQYEEDLKLHWATRLKLFIDLVDAGKSIESWLALELRSAFERVLSGEVWEDSIALPGREFRAEWKAFSPREIRDRDICHSVCLRIVYDKLGTQAACRAEAEYRHLSYETIRAAYYLFHDEIRTKYPRERPF
jgi:hypothetical protein